MASIPQVSFGQYPQRPMPTRAQVPQYGPGLRNLGGAFQNLNENLTENEKLKMAYQELLQKKRDAILARRQADEKAAFEQRKHDEGMAFKKQEFEAKEKKTQADQKEQERMQQARSAAATEYLDKLETLPPEQQKDPTIQGNVWRRMAIKHGLEKIPSPSQQRVPSVVINNQQKAQQAESMIPALESQLQQEKSRLAEIMGSPHLKTVTTKNLFDELEKMQVPQEPEQRRRVDQQSKVIRDLLLQLSEAYATARKRFPTEKIYSQPEADPRDPAGLGIYE